MEDSFKHKGLRNNLIRSLVLKGISSSPVLEAMKRVPRHLFLDKAFLEIAYTDVAFPIGEGQTISHPYTVAFQTQLLHVKKGEKVLEIGTGSGYQTAVLCELGAKVFSVERQQALFRKTEVFLGKLNYAPKLFYGDGYLGLPTFAPFHKIIVTAGAPYIPDALIEQLMPNGILIIPIDEGDGQVMYEIRKDADGVITQIKHGEFKFVPMLQERKTFQR
jgi:protein-L-isoaspartate(D-aspartate) O-methyltransferase